MSTPDPLRALQYAASVAAGHILPGTSAVRVVVFGPGGARLLDVAVPVGLAATLLAETPPPAKPPAAGWSFESHQAFFDGQTVLVGPSRLRLLRAIVDAKAPMSGKELAKVYGDHADEESVRFHVRALRKELASAFPDYEGEIIPNNGDGYFVALR